jgi:hypothetical protein
MKHLSDSDIEKICGDFSPDSSLVARHSSFVGARGNAAVPNRIDLHGKTEEQAWTAIVAIINSGARNATIITGASGILKQKFVQWMTESIISDRIISYRAINNGSFEIKIRRTQRANHFL